MSRTLKAFRQLRHLNPRKFCSPLVTIQFFFIFSFIIRSFKFAVALQDRDHSGASSSELEEIVSDDDMEGQSLVKGIAPESGPSTEIRNLSTTARDSPRAKNPTDALNMVKQTKKLFVRNLPYKANEADLINLFEGFGDVVDVRLATDKKTSR